VTHGERPTGRSAGLMPKRELSMTYRVFQNRLVGSNWIVMNATTGTTIGSFKTKSAAMKCARLLAGWRSKVELV
jgi:hypothetical protein